jgi:hypothetical protein
MNVVGVIQALIAGSARTHDNRRRSACIPADLADPCGHPKTLQLGGFER